MIIVSAAQTRLLASRSPLAADWPRRCAMHAEGDLAEVPVHGRLQWHVTAPPRSKERLAKTHSRGSLSYGRRSFQHMRLARCHLPDGDTDTRPQTSTKRTIFQRPSYVPDSRNAKARPDTFVFPRDPSHPIGIAGRAQRVQLGDAVGVGADNICGRSADSMPILAQPVADAVVGPRLPARAVARSCWSHLTRQ